VLSPQAPYEIYGHTPHTVFMNDLIFYRGQWWMYYGAADSVIALATASLRAGS
jgi:beta-1,2-mannosidase